MKSQANLAEIARLYHIHSYALARALTEVIGEGQAVLVGSYAKAFINLAHTAGFILDNPESFILHLKRIGLAECRLKRNPNGQTEFIVEKCSLAPVIHEPLGLEGYTGDLCPLALMAMIALAREKGWIPDKNFFNYIKFTGQLSFFTKDGTKTLFQT